MSIMTMLGLAVFTVHMDESMFEITSSIFGQNAAIFVWA